MSLPVEALQELDRRYHLFTLDLARQTFTYIGMGDYLMLKEMLLLIDELNALGLKSHVMESKVLFTQE